MDCEKQDWREVEEKWQAEDWEKKDLKEENWESDAVQGNEKTDECDHKIHNVSEAQSSHFWCSLAGAALTLSTLLLLLLAVLVVLHSQPSLLTQLAETLSSSQIPAGVNLCNIHYTCTCTLANTSSPAGQETWPETVLVSISQTRGKRARSAAGNFTRLDSFTPPSSHHPLPLYRKPLPGRKATFFLFFGPSSKRRTRNSFSDFVYSRRCLAVGRRWKGCDALRWPGTG